MADILHPPTTDESAHQDLEHLRTERPRQPRRGTGRGTDRGPDRGPAWIVVAVAVAVVLAAVAFTILLTRGGEAPESRDDAGTQTVDPTTDAPTPTARTTPPNRPRATDVIVPDLGGLPIVAPPTAQPQALTPGNRPAATDAIVPDLSGLPMPATGAADQAGLTGSAPETGLGSVRCELTEPITAC
jgi:hypothetical protein